MSVRGPGLRRKEEHKNAQALARQILNHPKLKGKLYGKKYKGHAVEIEVVTTEEELQPKEVIVVKPVKKKLSVEEKLRLLDELAGSAKRFSPEGVEETIRIANRDYDQEDDDN
ncbi:MAG: hypothetical protein K0S80_5014 [Neobacillus sp.]|nr:hypothetical protein [Neobacillus sp.]